MIDIHTHILPGVDDGAEDLTDAVLMAELAAESGVEVLFATPHSNLLEEPWEELHERQNSSFLLLKQQIEARGIPLRLLRGMEIFVTEDVPEKIRNGSLLSLNDSGYYLVEFDFFASGRWIGEMLERICALGVIPIVAHPERYTCVQKHPEMVRDWMDLGAQLQMNRGSIFGKFGRASFRAADWLLHEDWITYIASDAHSPYRRTTYMKDIQEFLQEEYSYEKARRILLENPQRFLLSKKERQHS